MFIIRDAEGSQRARLTNPNGFQTLDEAIKEGPISVHMSPCSYPHEYPFVVVDLTSGEVVHQWDLPA
ncbi:hypothetical protein AWB76_07193 [Caballeronia temeraria]|uniref:Uncharacterized protein n=1 Tax=Caballeronia temeraria TaxID=1777137 RepID=A0A158DMI7_9BURK|nr:hypothetical protein AWB76_07193 [Caballeronia temeraria]